jgi:biopolymer transport protein ExbD
MVDMFVILLVFLLKSYSTSPVNLTADKNLNLPVSTSTKDPADALKLAVSKSGIFVDDKKVLSLENGKIANGDIDASDPQFIRALYSELDVHAKKSRGIAAVNDTVEFEGKLIMQADRDMPYELLKKVMYTSMMAGYADVKLAVMTKD